MKEVTTPAQSTLPPAPHGSGALGDGRAGLPPGWVSGRARRLEPWLLAAIAIALTAVAVFLQADVQSAATVALLPLLAAAWAQARPAWRQRELAVRAFAVAAAALLLPLQETPDAVTPEALWQLWLALVVVAYAVLLRPAWALGLLAFSVLQWAPAWLLAPDPAVHGPSVGLLLVPLALAALLVGGWLRRADAGHEAHRFDPATRLCTLEGLLAHGEELLAARSRSGATLAVFDCSDLLEVRHIYGSRVARTLLHRLSGKLAAIAGDRGLAARTGPVEFAVLLPGAGRERALATLQHVLGAPSRIEYEAGDSEIMLVPDFLLGRLGEEEDDLAGLHRLLSHKLAWTREQEARRRRYLRLERERHSQSMPLSPGSRPHARSARASAAKAGRPELPSTLPLPLGAR